MVIKENKLQRLIVPPPCVLRFSLYLVFVMSTRLLHLLVDRLLVLSRRKHPGTALIWFLRHRWPVCTVLASAID